MKAPTMHTKLTSRTHLSTLVQKIYDILPLPLDIHSGNFLKFLKKNYNLAAVQEQNKYE